MKHDGKSGGKEDVKFKQTRLKAILLSKSDCLSKNAIHIIKVERVQFSGGDILFENEVLEHEILMLRTNAFKNINFINE